MSSQNAKRKNILFSPWSLSLAGFLPFACLALLIIVSAGTHPLGSLFVDMFKIWSALILSFLGGIRWGAAISNVPSNLELIETDQQANVNGSQLVCSVIPSIIALLALLLPSAYCIAVLMLCFCAQGAWDSISALRGDLPKWMGKLRIVLTILVVITHALVFLSLA